MIAVLHFRGDRRSDQDDFAGSAHEALRVLALRPGFSGGRLGRSTDEHDAWVLVTEWESVGAYRRALGSFDVKMVATPLLSQAEELPSVFETLLSISEKGVEIERASDLADDAESVDRMAERLQAERLRGERLGTEG